MVLWIFNYIGVIKRNPTPAILKPSPSCGRAFAGLDLHDGVHAYRINVSLAFMLISSSFLSHTGLFITSISIPSTV